jgi:nitroimidazol reductase NimA-like FMN-containing flavoprotein (pyridoxamine 5'-phosphate oxidase superfamily)
MQDLTREQVDWVLGDWGLGVLALASGGDAYAIPIYYARNGDAFFFRSRHGIKEDFIRDTRQGCLVVTKVESMEDWRSVQVLGRIDTLTGSEAEAAAEGVLRYLPLPPEWNVTTTNAATRSPKDLFIWRLVAEKVTGRKDRPRSV